MVKKREQLEIFKNAEMRKGPSTASKQGHPSLAQGNWRQCQDVLNFFFVYFVFPHDVVQ